MEVTIKLELEVIINIDDKNFDDTELKEGLNIFKEDYKNELMLGHDFKQGIFSADIIDIKELL